MVLLVGCANIGDLRHLIVEDSRADKSGNEGGEHLTIKRGPRRNVDVMGEFEILCKVECVRGGDVSVSLEIVHGCGVTGEPETTEQFGDNVKGDLHIGDSHDDPARNTEDDGEEDTIQYNSRGGVGGVNGDTGGTNTDGHTQYDEVDPLRDLLI